MSAQPEVLAHGLRSQHRLRIAWVTDTARLTGGTESYIVRTVEALKAEGVQSTLYYDVLKTPVPDPALLPHFDGIYPLVNPQRQLQTCAFDVIYIQKWT